jgi:hypothetical protein
MLFDDKKLSAASVDDLLQCPVHTVEPFALMLAPIYVLMKLNQKLVSVKAPLDFFLPDEIEGLKRYETFYIPKFVQSSVPFQTAARVVKNILNSSYDGLSPASFEISHEVFCLMAPLWGKDLRVEPFFMAIFAHELCSPLTPEQIIWARNQAVVRHDLGLILSGSFVFLAVQLGWSDYAKINAVRNEIYERTVRGDEWSDPVNEVELMVSGLYAVISEDRSISNVSLSNRDDEWARKISSRLNSYVMRRGLPKVESPTIYGNDGFAA